MDESAIVLRDSEILEGPPLGGAEEYEPLFIINLCAAMTPLNLESSAIPGFEQYKLYQVSRMEDGRRRYRLRLGFFTSESMAEDVLCSVRQRYATAFTSCLADEDLKHASGYLKRSVQDLARTGRFKISKPRDLNATGMMRALKPSPIIDPAHEPRTAAPAAMVKPAAPKPVAAPAPAANRVAKTDEVVEIDLTPVAKQAAPATVKPHAPIAQADSSSTARMPALKDTTMRSATLSETGILRRPSLMQQAHAMASADAADRAKVMATIERNAETSATGKFKTPAVPDVGATGRFKVPAAASESQNSATGTVKAQPAAPALTASTPPVAPAKPAAPKSQPFHVGAGVQIPETSLTLEGAPLKPATHVSPIVQTPQHSAADNSLSPDLMRARELAKQSAMWRQAHGEVPTLDTTQTIRTLTKSELEDQNRDKWYTVQLAISDQPANLDTMPRLDIFEAYTLYSVATMDGGRIRHALRLGFFREEVSAEAVMGYLRTFFNEPTITRISDAEHERFQNAPKITALKPAPNVIALDQKRPEPAQPTPPQVPTVNTVARPAANPAQRTATATKRSGAPVAKKTAAKAKPKSLSSEQKDLLEEARLLGLSDTQIIRVQKNPSLLSRLVGKLTK